MFTRKMNYNNIQRFVQRVVISVSQTKYYFTFTLTDLKSCKMGKDYIYIFVDLRVCILLTGFLRNITNFLGLLARRLT